MKRTSEHYTNSRETPSLDMYILAQKLSPESHDLVEGFDKGLTLLRDVGRMVTAQRDAILEAYRNGTVADLASEHPELLSIPVQNLHERVKQDQQDQPVGRNFFVNAKGFLEAGRPWARDLDTFLQSRLNGSDIDSLLKLPSDARMEYKGKEYNLLDAVLLRITEDPASFPVLAIHLAGRSFEGEEYLNRRYGEVMRHAKDHVYATTEKIGRTTQLRTDMFKRATGQLQRTSFGSFDHLDGLVTSEDTGVAGDYLSGSLRVELQLGGNVSSPKLPNPQEAYATLAHGLHHAASAQT